ncbi:shikimate dehydrogenase [Brevibacterium sanguinis]|uniref:Shikimate dehydrogenase (NADP(+)) n=2 Tax=Brevibacterium TaxID=1696 RepID=A0A366IMN9_9MICO|nr:MULTISPECIES: shikimate dehydrogenase [Brevibacterium]RBP65682.1 shikimate dehydrogenase [Brevibacterium sanguinis]RBP72316.1 shikimate dehydrogenase [Brevibacterium celere]
MDRTVLLGLIGEGIAASRTPRMHETEGDVHGIRTLYRTLDVTAPRRREASLAELLTAARLTGFDGLNITHPFKQQVLELLDEVDPGAATIGSVNTVVIAEDGTTTGHNTDVTGFARGFAEGLENARTERVVQIGAGGAGRAVAFALSSLGVGELVIADTSAERAEALAADIGSGVRAISTDVLGPAIVSADGIVNATPVGMAAFPGTPFDTDLLEADKWVADVVYFPLETQLLKEARAKGCRTLDGSGMAVNQAVDAFELFTGVRASATRMRATFLSFGA